MVHNALDLSWACVMGAAFIMMIRLPRVRGPLLAVGFLLLTGCGSSPTPSTITISSEASLNGSVTSTGRVEVGMGPYVGDTDRTKINGEGWRQFYSFSLSTVPAGARMTSATLRLYQAFVKGQPYTALGNVIVDHVNLGSTLVASAYDGGTLASNIGTLSTNATLEYKTLDVLSSVQDDLTANRGRSQYRLRFSLRDSNADLVDDFVQFTDAQDSCCRVNRPPQLVIVHTP